MVRSAAPEEPFSSPQAAVITDERFEAPLPEERHYRPIPRSFWLVRMWGLVVAALVSLVLLGRMGVASFQAVIAIWVVVVFLILRPRLGVSGWVKRNEAAAAALASGEIGEASSSFEALCHQARAVPILHSLFVFNRGVAYIHEQQARRALSLFAATLKARWTRSAQIPNFHAMVLGEVATALAIEGETEQATRFLRLAQEQMSERLRGRLCLTDALVALRVGEPQRAAAEIEAHWQLAEGSLGARGIRALRVLWAFALDRAPGERRDERLMRRLLDGAWPFSPGELDYLAARWPELATFLQRHGFTRASPAG